jgi:DNA-directed RNA polymerase, mitochondrial
VRIGQPGIWWLKVSTANCFNEGGRITRLPFEERVQWVDENLERIRLIADNPRLGLKYLKPTNEGKLWLEEAADPFQFIAPARELVAAIDAGPDFVTTLPLPLDASNSGAQHYAMLARDPDGAKLTNLTFDGEIRCLYTEAGKIINNNLAVMIEEGSKAERRRANYWLSQNATGRKLMKRLTVPYLYGQRELKAQKVLLDALAEESRIADGYDDDHQVKWRRPRASDIPHRSWFVKRHRVAIAAVFPGLKPVMDLIRNCATTLAVHGEVLRWASPSGVEVCNRYNVPDPNRKSYYLGAKRVQHKQAYVFRPELDKAGCARGAAPNLVHSLDAAHLAFVALACEADRIPLLTVHDCFATLGCHVDAVREIWLRELVAMYENADMLKQVYDYTRRYGTPPPIPKPRGLELSKVNGPYALS